MFRKRGIDLERVYNNFKIGEEATKKEIDILGINGQYVVAIEIKSTLSV
ncbi:hypothetical protein MBAV_005094, partial [Candidatus Magnetobacterium bavaricum]